MISPLHGKRIIITRPTKEAGGLRRKLTELGAKVYCTPAIAIVNHQLSASESALLSEPSKFQGLVFSSRHGVRTWLEQIRALGGTKLLQAWLNGSHHLAAVGAKTATYLKRIFGRAVLFPENATGATALIPLISRKWPALPIENIMLPVALDEGEELLAGLTQLSYQVQRLPCYRTQVRTGGEIDLTPWQQGKIDGLLFYSPSAAQAYFDALQQRSQQALALISQVFVIGEKTYKACNSLGFKNVALTGVSNLRESVDTLEQTLR